MKKTAQQIQDGIFRRMSIRRKAELVGSFWRAAQVLQHLRTNSKFSAPCQRRCASGGKILNSKKGSVLVELIVVIAVIGLVAGTIGGIFYANQRGSEEGRIGTLESGLTQEAINAIKIIATSNDATSQGWNRVYCPPNAAEPDEGGDCAAAGVKNSSTAYQVKAVGTLWKLFQGAESVLVSDETYTRAINIQNMCRDALGNVLGITNTDGAAETCASGDWDPSTLKITVTITPPKGTATTTVLYITRSINKQTSPSVAPAAQTDWSGGINCTPVVSEFGTQYCASDANEDVTGGAAGSIKILTQ